ncbi:MAG: hypothetical protein METHP_01039 [Methanoregula sp. SKADARSKE-2]|nr:MAG: hypothetical protein METHP_01039 [Methanoregula sp. SKADARSKE-2]
MIDLLEFIVILVVLGAIFYVIYYFLHRAQGKISLTRPVESRVDEYLDRRFQSIVEEWQLVTQTGLQEFRQKGYKELEQDEARLESLKKFESSALDSLQTMEARLDAVEKELAQKRASKK